MCKLLTLVVLIVMNLFFTHPVMAHALKTDGTLGAILHIDPDDSPIAGDLSTFVFEFTTTNGQFSIDQCQCQVSITQSDKEVYHQQLSDIAFTYVFPEKDIYQLTVTGKPQFKLKWDIRVEKQTAPSQNFNYWIIGGIMAVLFLSAFIYAKKH